MIEAGEDMHPPPEPNLEPILLAEHAATALFSAQLYAQSKRKLDLFQGLCQLLTESTDTGK